MLYVALPKRGIMEIYDGFTGEALKLGDVLRSIERGDMVRVDEMGERWCGSESMPTIRLEALADVMGQPFEGTMIEEDGRWILTMYTKLGAKEPALLPPRRSRLAG